MVREVTQSDRSRLQVDLATVDNIMKFCVAYHPEEDTLFLRPGKALPGTSIDWNGEIWIRVNIRTGAIVGLEIDEFQSVFLKRHPELDKAWSRFKLLSKKQQQSACTGPAVLIILNFFKTVLEANRNETHLATVTR
ncbi:MAG: hypothetical protein HYY29_00510 [Chloroflexi bacterium]|nr:hypothetical protein [Chloroflexota bacterium]